MSLMFDLNTEAGELDLSGLIREGRLAVNFQPIASVSRKTVVGIEGLIRGIGDNGRVISPRELFDAAYAEELTVELDRLCRDKVLEAFSKIHRQFPGKLLFLNVETSILGKTVGSDYLLKQVLKHQINPGNIVIEVNESKTQNTAALKRFTDAYREYGFRIALDDVGTGFSNMDRIILIKPDIIKIDISLVRNVEADYYKQGVFLSLANLSNKIGALVVAEGVETSDEAIQILKLGVHMIQGFYIARPAVPVNPAALFASDATEILSRDFSRDAKRLIVKNKSANNRMNRAANQCIRELAPVPCSGFDRVLEDYLQDKPEIECAYVLDRYGIQVSSTVYASDEFRQKENLLFFSAKTGTDHSMEKYFYPLISANLKSYITEPYISLATGSLCTTVSKVYRNSENETFILCVDFRTEDDTNLPEFKRAAAMRHRGVGVISDMDKIVGRLNREVYLDALTGIYNRRFIEEQLITDIFNASYMRQPVSILMADIDFFKNINDTYGHSAGDLVLKEFAATVRSMIRKNSDWVARYGGEEFLIVLFNSDEDVAYRVAEKIRNAVAAREFRCKDQVIHITASFGANTVHSEKITCEQIIEKADQSLYSAKSSGRNRTVCLE